MKNKYMLVAGLIALFLLAGCAGTPTQETQSIDIAPDWYQMEADSDYYYGFGQGNSNQLNVASRQAQMTARQGIAANLEAAVQSMAQEGIRQDLSSPEVQGAFETATRELVEQRVVGAETFASDRQREADNSITVWVGMRVPRNVALQTSDDVLERMDEQLRMR